MHKKLLMVLAVLCQFLVLFPFLVMSEGIGFGEFVWWHYAAMYAAAAGFWAVGRLMGLHSGLYLYLLPGCIAAYYGGSLSVGSDYSEVFSSGWFGVYFVAAVIAAVLLSFTNNDFICSAGMTQL